LGILIPLELCGIYSSIDNWFSENALYHMFMSIFAILIAIGNLIAVTLISYDKPSSMDDDTASPQINKGIEPMLMTKQGKSQF